MASKENQEALNTIGNIDLQQYDYETELIEGAFSPIYAGECYRDEFDALQKAINDLELYKKAFELVCKDYAYEYDTDGKEYEKEYLEKAKESEKQNG